MRFVIGWLWGLVFLIAISIIRHWDFIAASVSEQLWIVVDGAVPCLIIIVMIFYMIKSAFK